MCMLVFQGGRLTEGAEGANQFPDSQAYWAPIFTALTVWGMSGSRGMVCKNGCYFVAEMGTILGVELPHFHLSLSLHTKSTRIKLCP